MKSNEMLQQSNQAKERLLSIIAHDIRSPFNGLMGFINILHETYDKIGAEKHKKYIEIIKESSEKIYLLTDTLLIRSKIQHGGFVYSPKSLNLKEVVQKCSSIFSEIFEDKHITLNIQINESISVFADDFMLSTIFRNLISNAVKFTHSNGAVSIGIEDNKPKGINEITIYVQDSGIGIPDEKINTLFSTDVNFSTYGTHNEKGTGIGLSLCKEFIDFHGTDIWVESTPNVGSRFIFNLKISKSL